ncbi:MAG: hypothetical protein HQK50_11630 [Oligoflexia bacterium]|nr:hypothetical protein [Oligoflexia bacterium]MBF0366214.1 hypothetical protein [Oligoflexia bacterium]
MQSRFYLMLMLLTLFACCLPLASSATDDTSLLRDTLAQRLESVPEFKQIKQVAEEMGLQLYLFGGAAAAYAHYVHRDLERTIEKRAYDLYHFSMPYDLFEIYRLGQDIDLVVNASPEEAMALQAKLDEILPWKIGNKSLWEVRTLKDDFHDKMGLLSKEYLNQNNDSNSMGLIEITGKHKVIDLSQGTEWEKSNGGKFLEDISQNAITFYRNPKHATTKRYLELNNPEIFSVIRYLTKAFQYNLLPLSKHDQQTIAAIVRDFNPEKDLQTNYARHWIIANGSKLIKNAMNMEAAFDLLDQLGLRKKLATITIPSEMEEGHQKRYKGLDYWMKKEPLRTLPLQLDCPPGQSAKELNIDTITHNTNSEEAYDSIMADFIERRANAFISRQGYEEEHATYGEGFYVSIGDSSNYGDSQYAIQFKLHPKACAGRDFEVVADPSHPNWMLIKNKAAIERIQKLPAGVGNPLLFLSSLLKNNNGKQGEHQVKIDFRMERKIAQAIYLAPIEEVKSILALPLEKLGKNGYHLLKEIMARPSLAQMPMLFTRLRGAVHWCLQKHERSDADLDCMEIIKQIDPSQWIEHQGYPLFLEDLLAWKSLPLKPFISSYFMPFANRYPQKSLPLLRQMIDQGLLDQEKEQDILLNQLLQPLLNLQAADKEFAKEVEFLQLTTGLRRVFIFRDQSDVQKMVTRFTEIASDRALNRQGLGRKLFSWIAGLEIQVQRQQEENLLPVFSLQRQFLSLLDQERLRQLDHDLLVEWGSLKRHKSQQVLAVLPYFIHPPYSLVGDSKQQQEEMAQRIAGIQKVIRRSGGDELFPFRKGNSTELYLALKQAPQELTRAVLKTLLKTHANYHLLFVEALNKQDEQFVEELLSAGGNISKRVLIKDEWSQQQQGIAEMATQMLLKDRGNKAALIVYKEKLRQKLEIEMNSQGDANDLCRWYGYAQRELLNPELALVKEGLLKGFKDALQDTMYIGGFGGAAVGVGTGLACGAVTGVFAPITIPVFCSIGASVGFLSGAATGMALGLLSGHTLLSGLSEVQAKEWTLPMTAKAVSKLIIDDLFSSLAVDLSATL